MTQSFDLLSLPANVFSEVSCFVGSFREFVRLDSAYCHHHFRETWLHVLGSKQFTLHCEVDISVPTELSWVLQKRLQCSSVKFSLEIEALKNLLNFLRDMGSSIRTICFEDETKSHPMTLVASYCHHLTSLNVQDLIVTCAMREIMLSNPNLQEIHCTDVKCSETDIFAGVALHKLKKLYIDTAYCSSGFPWHETAFSDSLRKVVLDNSDFHTADLKALFRNCPALQIFGSNSLASLAVDEYDTIVLNGKLDELYLCDNDTLTDAHLLSLLKRLPSITLLAVQHCALLTDASLQYIAEYAGPQLQKLYIDIKHPESSETESILDVFSQKCIKLKSLGIHCGDKVLCNGKGTGLIVRGCPQLKELWVNKFSTITASSLIFIAQLRPDLCIHVGTLSAT